MRKHLATIAGVVVVVLSGCAGTALDSECWRQGQQTCVMDPRYGLVTSDGRAVTPEGKIKQARDEEAQRQRVNEARKEAENRAEWERAQKEKLARQQDKEEQAARRRIAADESRGYRHVSFGDLFLDYKSLPLGSKRAVKAIYQVFGQLETLSGMPVDGPFSSAPTIIALTDAAPRDVRAKLLSCRRIICPAVFLGHTVTCTVTKDGRRLPIHVCFAVDDVW